MQIIAIINTHRKNLIYTRRNIFLNFKAYFFTYLSFSIHIQICSNLQNYKLQLMSSWINGWYASLLKSINYKLKRSQHHQESTPLNVMRRKLGRQPPFLLVVFKQILFHILFMRWSHQERRYTLYIWFKKPI